MIETKEQLMDFLKQDAKACKRKEIRFKLFGDELWKYQYCYRMVDYYRHKKEKRPFDMIPAKFWTLLINHYSIKLGFTISSDATIGKGFSIAHYGSIVIHGSTVIGDNCRIHEGVCIGATNGGGQAAVIGNNVFIATGAKIIGDVRIADDVAVGANAVVVKDIPIPHSTWGGGYLLN